MKYNLTMKFVGSFLSTFTSKTIHDKQIIKDIKKEYKNIIERASDIGANNKLIFSYILAAYFIAMNRKGPLNADENIKIIEDAIKNSKLFKLLMGNADNYFSEKNMESRRKWSKETYLKKYKNDWVVEVLEKTDDYQFGFNYHECGVCKLCKDENCFELAKYLCRLDFLIAEIIGVKLKRTKTLADGDDYCDFRFIKK